VTLEGEPGAETALRVTSRGGLSAPTVMLRPAAGLWDCDCRGVEDPCEHVAAAVIALRQTRERGAPLPATRRLGYRLRREGVTLHFERVVVGPEGEAPLRGTLFAVAAGRLDGPAFSAGEADLEVERALGSSLRGALPPPLLRRLLAPLSRCADLLLDGEPVRADPEPWLPVARVEDCAEGFRVRLVAGDEVAERLAEGLVRCGGRLRPLGATGLTARDLEDYGRGVVVPLEDAARLVTEVLPALAERLPLDVRTGRLPPTSREAPRLRVQVRREGDALSVLATLVYGDPPRARVDAGRLVHLGGAVPLRDPAQEARLLRRLRETLGLAPGQRLTVGGEEALALAERLRRLDAEVEGDAHQAFFRAPALRPRLALAEEAFELAFEAPGGEGRPPGRVDAARVLRAWREGKSLVPLLEGGFAPLPADWLARFGDRLANLLRERDAAGRVPGCLLPDLAALCEDRGLEPPRLAARLRACADDFAGVPAAALPTDLRAELRGYQRRGVDWLCWLRDAGLGALLADDMGLGKTLQALCALRGRSLVVCPTSVLVAWQEQAARFRPGLTVSCYHGPARRLDPDADLTLTSYALLRLDAEPLAAVDWDTVLLDEAQAIKNVDSQVARAAFALRGRFRAALSGTPVENRLEELWSLFHFLDPSLLGPRAEFLERTARPVAAGDDGAAARLRERIRPFVLRRLKSEVARELPPRTERVLRCELSAPERAVYQAVLAATRPRLVARLAAGAGVLEALEAFLRLRQACCHPSLVPGQSAPGSAKLEVLLEELECAAAEGHRALVFSQWTGLLDLVEPELGRAGIAFTRLDGSTRDRAGVVSGFQRPDGPPVLLVSLRAGGTGLDLTAADHVFLLDPWWNPAVEDQAADRAHRIGQTRPVVVHRLVARDTVEERILELQARKRGLADAALAGGTGAAELTRDDLLALLD
jgi:superfamily II DNA or RNA helicase